MHLIPIQIQKSKKKRMTKKPKGKNLPKIIKWSYEMDISNIYMNNIYLILSFINNNKNTTFKTLNLTSITFMDFILSIYYLLINLIIYLIKNNLFKFKKTSNLNLFFYLNKYTINYNSNKFKYGFNHKIYI
jgi:hypothetical protein